MNVLILGQPKILKVTTVTLERDPDNPLALYVMHCLKCAEKLVQYQGNIIRVMPGGLPQNILELSSNLIIECRRCRSRYLINNVV